jgi:hypothetical protein
MVEHLASQLVATQLGPFGCCDLATGDGREEPNDIAIAKPGGIRLVCHDGRVIDRDQQTWANGPGIAQQVRSAGGVAFGQMRDKFSQRPIGRPTDILFAAARRRSQLS